MFECSVICFRATHIYAVGGSAGSGSQIARMELGDEDTWGQLGEGAWQTGGGLETKEPRPSRPAVRLRGLPRPF